MPAVRQFTIGRGGFGVPVQRDEIDPFLRDYYGMTRQEFAAGSPDQRGVQMDIRRGSPYDPESGLPLRPARDLEEAASFAFAQNRYINRLAQQAQQDMLRTFQSQLGLVQRGGPGSLHGLLSPLYQNIAATLGTVNYQPFEFAAGAVGTGVGGLRIGGGGLGRPTRPTVAPRQQEVFGPPRGFPYTGAQGVESPFAERVTGYRQTLGGEEQPFAGDFPSPEFLLTPPETGWRAPNAPITPEAYGAEEYF